MIRLLILYISIGGMFFQCAIGAERVETEKNYSVVELQKKLETKEVKLWSLIKTPIDEEGFVSIKEYPIFNIDTIDIKQNVKTYDNIVITFNNKYSYHLQKDSSCDASNKAYTEIYNTLIEGSVFCIANYKNSYPLMMVIGNEQNIKVLKIKENKKYHNYIEKPSIKNYVVKTEKIS